MDTGDRDARRRWSVAGSPSSWCPARSSSPMPRPAPPVRRSGRHRQSSAPRTPPWPPTAEALNAAGRVTILAGAGCAGAHQAAHRPRRGFAGADRARVSRQGVRRVRQPLRRGDDRADRVQLGLPGHGALRHPGHARHRLPLPAVLSGRGAGDPGRRARRADRTPRAGPDPARRHRGGHGRRAAPAAQAQVRFSPPGPDDCALQAGPRPAGQAGRRPAERVTAASAVCRRHDRPARRARRDLHRRRRHALRLGCALPAHERHPPADRLFQPRVHGQRAAAGHRGPSQPAGPPGHQPVRRRRASPCCSENCSRCASSIFR